jgi:hypothetical protein
MRSEFLHLTSSHSCFVSYVVRRLLALGSSRISITLKRGCSTYHVYRWHLRPESTVERAPDDEAKRALRLRADTVGLCSSNFIASYDEELAVPKCSSEGSSVILEISSMAMAVETSRSRSAEPNYPNTLCITKTVLMEQVVDHLMNLLWDYCSLESGGYMTAESTKIHIEASGVW